MNLEEIDQLTTITPLWNTHHVQVCQYDYKGFECIERTYFPPGCSIGPIRTFYSFWVGHKPVTFKNGQVADDPYKENSFYIVFENWEEMVEFLEQWESK